MDSICSSASCTGDVDVLLMTANVGSLFEDPLHLLRPWLDVFFSKVQEINPKFLALHLQEVGGKTYEKSMEYVQEFIKSLCEAPQMVNFEYIRIYMDEDFKSAEHFTALGNLYFIHNALKNPSTWNFVTNSWESAEGKKIFFGNIEAISTKEKSKFPQHFFPECKWSRKGFMRTRWELNNTVFDLVNIHLFHDASNLAACEEYPSVYCKTRRRALVHTLERFHLDQKNGLAPIFIFGDFNFRCDTEGVIKEVTESLAAHRIHNTKNDSTKIYYRNSAGDTILTIGKKEFNHADHQFKFKEPWLKKFDRELEPIKDILVEFPINFPPSYPYEEDPEMPTYYMPTRCPSWCDRVLMSIQAKGIIQEMESPNVYDIMGEEVCMGDHKPVYLNIRIKPNQGTYRCCKCFLLNANNNKSTSHQIPAETIASLCGSSKEDNSKIYNQILLEYKELNKNTNNEDEKDAKVQTFIGQLSETFGTCRYCQNDGSYNEAVITKYPPVSINIIDSDNIHVCSVKNALVNDSVDGSLCSECQNIIKSHQTKPINRLISKRLVLTKNIIVNRMDTQHLSNFFEISPNPQDPYTPESAESHSPYSELASSPTTSSNNRSAAIDSGQQQPLSNICIERSCKQLEYVINCNDNIKKQQRSIVSPVQLKSRLEDLQKKSLIQNRSFKNKKDGEIAGNSDVEGVDDICNSTNITAVHQYPNSCLPKCCNIH